jgi:hypothetical protein
MGVYTVSKVSLQDTVNRLWPDGLIPQVSALKFDRMDGYDSDAHVINLQKRSEPGE